MRKIIAAKDLNEEQRKIFCDAFYEQWEYGEPDLDSSQPWGCPWHYFPDFIVYADKIEESAIQYYKFIQDSIENAFNQEEYK